MDETTTYVRIPGKAAEDATWHWRSRCPHYLRLTRRPDAITAAVAGGRRPASGELCNLCRGYERRAVDG